MRIALALLAAAVLLTGCGSQEQQTVTMQLDATDEGFVQLIRTHTHAFWQMSDLEIAGTGRDLCRVLARGGRVEDFAPVELPGAGPRQTTFFGQAAADAYCPQYLVR